MELGSRNEKPLTRYFPELMEPLRASLPERAVLDGEIVIMARARVSTSICLSLRIHPAASRIEKLVDRDPGRVRRVRPARVEGTDLREEPFRVRRAALETCVGQSCARPCTSRR